MVTVANSRAASRPERRPWALWVLGGVIAVLGLVLLGGGLWLLWLGGSAYYAIAGVGLLVSGILLLLRRAAGAWLYALVYAGTLVWAVAETGLRGWPLLPRVVGPTVLLLLVIAATPWLRQASWGWRSALAAGIAVVVVFAVVAVSIARPEVFERAGEVPHAGRMTMGDPATLQPGDDWPAYGGSYSARRFSPLDQITPQNVAKLERAWIFHTGDLPKTDTAKKQYGAENTPLKVGDRLFLCTPMSQAIAIDAGSGKELWRFDPQVKEEWIPYTAACRGVAYYEVPGAAGDCAARVIYGTLDARVIALDAATGKRCADFGDGGTVDTSLGMGEVVPGMLSITSAPTIVRGVVVIGHQVLDGQKLDAPSGTILGYDAVTGALRWAWDMTQPELHGLPPAGETFTRGTPNMWTTASGDEALGLVYLPLGNAAVDYWSSERSAAEKAYSTSLVALDVETGKPAWTFQAVHNDVWDYDLGSQATLVDFPGDAGPVPALVLPSKQGDIYVLDRRTGRPLTPVEERPVPQGGVEPEQRSPTQPFSGYHTLRRAELSEASMWGVSPIDQMICRIQFRMAAYDGFYTPPTVDQHWVEYPGYNGGSDWGGIAVDPARGVIVANYNDMPNYNRLVPRTEADRLGWAPRGEERGEIGGQEGAGDPQAGAPYAINVNAGWRLPATGMLCKEPPYGGIRAIDLATGATLWDRPLGEARTNGPFGIPSMLPIDIGTPNNGGPLVTAGGLIFIAAATDNLIRAIDIETGKTVWQDTLPAGGQATPMTYEMNGRQYVVIMAGGHHFMETPIGDAVIGYALPR